MRSKFLSDHLQSDVLYHCIPVTPHGDAISPSDRYGTDISPDVRRQLGIPADVKVPLVFASPSLNKAMAFALQGSLGEKIMNCSIDGSDRELVIACDRNAMLSRVRDITVYSFSGKGFVDLPYAERQSVSTRAVAFEKTQIALKASTAHDLMRAGLQIISFTETARHPDGSYPCLIEAMQKRGDTTVYPVIADMLRAGKMVWENQQAHLSPDPQLAQHLGLSTAVRAIKAKKTSTLGL